MKDQFKDDIRQAMHDVQDIKFRMYNAYNDDRENFDSDVWLDKIMATLGRVELYLARHFKNWYLTEDFMKITEIEMFGTYYEMVDYLTDAICDENITEQWFIDNGLYGKASYDVNLTPVTFSLLEYGLTELLDHMKDNFIDSLFLEVDVLKQELEKQGQNTETKFVFRK